MQISKVTEAVNKYIEKYGRTPKFKIQNKPVKQMVLKKDDIYKVTLSNGEVIYPAGRHPFMIDGEQVILNDCPVGTELYNGVRIVSKEFIKKDLVFDFELDTKDRTYFLAGVKHHNTKVFNAIRSLLLDKRVGSKKLPDDILITCAMNPFDEGTQELPAHFKDVIDVINSEADYQDFLTFLRQKKSFYTIDNFLGFKLSEILINMHNYATSTFESDIDTEGNPINDMNTRKYYWAPDKVNVFYISPREMDDMISGSLTNSYNGLRLIKKFDKTVSYNTDQIQDFANFIKQKITEKYTEILRFAAISKGQIEKSAFQKMQLAMQNIISDAFVKIVDGFNLIKSNVVVTVKSIVENVKYNIDELLNDKDSTAAVEKAFEDEDADEIKMDFAELIDQININFDLIDAFEKFLKLSQWLFKVDWSRYNSDVSSAISILFKNRAFSPITDKIIELDEDGAKYQKFIELQNNSTYKKLINSIYTKIKTKQNLFV